MGTVRELLEHHLEVLVQQIGARPPGSAANRRAVAHVRESVVRAGLEVVEQPFTTTWWEPGDGRLELAGGTVAPATPNPYSLPADVRGTVTRVDELDELEQLRPAPGRVLVLHGGLAQEQLLPAAFPFLDVPEHGRVRDAIVRLAPRAVIASSDHWQPVLEDPGLRLPSTTVPRHLGSRLRDGDQVRLVLGGAIHAGSGTNLAARTSDAGDRLVCSAHLDSKSTTPGAFDNAAGVATLLALAATHADELPACEFVFFNGEDHFDACGEVAWLTAAALDEVVANVNVDGVGLAGRGTSLASLACPSSLEVELDAWVGHRPGWTRAAPWIESDHAIFAMRGIPAVAITSEDVHELLGGLAHTDADTLEVLDLDVLEGLVVALPDLLARVWREALAQRVG